MTKREGIEKPHETLDVRLASIEESARDLLKLASKLECLALYIINDLDRIHRNLP